jgi:predicted dehydrogenase
VEHVFETADALIGSDLVDAVYIATPPSSHAELALRVAAVGKPCCVEKPIAIDHVDAMTMVNAFAAAGKPLFVAYYRRCLPRFEAIRAWLDEGRIGAVRHVHWTLTRPPGKADLARSPAWRVDPREAPGGYFDDLAGHGLDLFDHYFGPVGTVSGVTAQQAALYQVPDAFAASWLHVSGVTGSACWNFAAGARRDEVLVTGSDGHLVFAVFDDVPVVLMARGSESVHHIAHPNIIQEPHVAAMVRQLRGGAAHPSTGESAARTALVCDRILGQV